MRFYFSLPCFFDIANGVQLIDHDNQWVSDDLTIHSSFFRFITYVMAGRFHQIFYYMNFPTEL